MAHLIDVAGPDRDDYGGTPGSGASAMFPHPSTSNIRQPLRTTWGSLTLLDAAAIGLLLFTLARTGGGEHALSGDPRDAVPGPTTEPTDQTVSAGTVSQPIEVIYIVDSEADANLLHWVLANSGASYVAGYQVGYYAVLVMDEVHELTIANAVAAGLRVEYFDGYVSESSNGH